MGPPLAYEKVAAIVARHIYKFWYREEARINLPPIKTFDNMCSGSLQIPAGVLTKLKILEPIDSIARRTVFICEPDEFEIRANENQEHGCTYETVVLAVISLTDYGTDCTDLFECLMELGICKSIENRTRTYDISKVPDMLAELLPEALPSTLTVPSYKVTWTAQKPYYDELRKNWVSLIQ